MLVSYKLHGWELDVQQAVQEGTLFEIEFSRLNQKIYPYVRLNRLKNQRHILIRLFPKFNPDFTILIL